MCKNTKKEPHNGRKLVFFIINLLFLQCEKNRSKNIFGKQGAAPSAGGQLLP